MSKKKKGAVPRLRFPEFRNAGPWEVKALAEVLEEHGEKSNGTEEVYSVSVHKGLVNQIEHLGRNFAAQNTDHYNRVFPGDIVYTKSPTGDFPYGIIKQNKSGQTVIVSPLYGVFRPQNYAIGVLLDAFFESPSCAKIFLEPLVQKGAKNTINISNSRFLSGTLPLTQEPREQQKIADCLSSLDEVIELEAKRLDALKAHKKGLMQQLFPREGETTPRLRFPEFRNAGPWEVKRLGDVVSITGGGTPSRSRKDFWNGNIPWVSSSDVSDESIHELKITRWITSEAVSNSATKIVPENSILLVSRVGVGKVAISRTPVCTNQDFTNLTPIKDDVLFLGYYLSAWANVLKSFGQGMAILGFTKQDIENLAIPLPDANSGEQQKIADCLSSLDKLIELETKKLEALKEYKKGLMQQLFPTMEENA
jgi:type I restriction enzyme S subunit